MCHLCGIHRNSKWRFSIFKHLKSRSLKAGRGKPDRQRMPPHWSQVTQRKHTWAVTEKQDWLWKGKMRITRRMKSFCGKTNITLMKGSKWCHRNLPETEELTWTFSLSSTWVSDRRGRGCSAFYLGSPSLTSPAYFYMFSYRNEQNALEACLWLIHMWPVTKSEFKLLKNFIYN